MKNYSIFLLFVFVSCLPVALFAQSRTEPAVYGVYEDWELEMTSYDKDTTAPAVVLYEFESTNFIPGDVGVFRHRRIKILSESAYEDYGTVSFVYSRSHSLRNLAARVVYIDEFGTEVTHVLGEADFLIEDITDGLKKASFTYPNLRAGAIVEHKYNIYDKTTLGWVFDNPIPTLWSEYVKEMTGYTGMLSYTRGSTAYHIHDRSYEISDYARDNIIDRWVMKDLPAFIEEEFMPSTHLYRTRLGFYQSSFTYPGALRTVNYFENWEQEATDYNEYLVDITRRGRRTRRKAAEIIAAANASSDQEKMIALYNFVRDEIETNEYRGHIYVGDDTPTQVLKQGNGTATDKNTLLIDLLRVSGLEANPALIRYRSDGPVISFIQSFAQFDRVLAAVQMDGEYVYLDASDDLRPWNLLGLEDLVGEAILIESDSYRFVNLAEQGLANHRVLVNATLDEEFILTAEVTTLDESFRALGLRRISEEHDGTAVEFVRKNLLDDLVTGEIETAYVEDSDDLLEPFRTTATIIAEEAIQESGAFLYISPVMFDRYDGNVFSKEERKYDIDFIYPTNDYYVFSLTVPEGYEVDELPANVRYSLPDNAASIRRTVVQNGGIVQYIYQEKWNQAFFAVEEYGALKAYFDHILKMQDEVIVLKVIGSETISQTEDLDSAGGESAPDPDDGK